MPLPSRYSSVTLTIPRLVGLLIFLGLGIFFRFANLEQIYWHDEAYTSLRLSGFTAMELNQSLFQGQVVSVADLMNYQWPNPQKKPS